MKSGTQRRTARYLKKQIERYYQAERNCEYQESYYNGKFGNIAAKVDNLFRNKNLGMRVWGKKTTKRGRRPIVFAVNKDSRRRFAKRYLERLGALT